MPLPGASNLNGNPTSLGLSLTDEGVNVAVVSRHASAVYFCLFDGEDEVERILLSERLGDVHFGHLKGVEAGARYGLRADGPYDSASGHLFDVSKLLVDPYAHQIDRAFSWHPDLARRGADTTHLVPKAVVGEVATSASLLGTKRPEFIYEIATKAFTRLHPDIPEGIRGTVAALGHPVVIEYLSKLGVDTVELMPLMAWIDERHLPPLGLSNAWGYNPISLFSPDPRLAPGGLVEVRQAISALHDAGIRVVLDVVFNHTGESDLEGPTLSLRGLDNALYYRYHEGQLVNDTGCGNTLATDRSPVVQLIADAMRHWVRTTGIDGFRYDLAPVMGRIESGFSENSPLLSVIGQDPLLSSLIHIAEPWDIGPGGYQLGKFPAPWQEWNDHFRDDVRKFWRGNTRAQGGLATRLAGSSDIFLERHRAPSCSVNFVATHDGFTLADTVAFNSKNNFLNGEDNRDGNANEVSWVSPNAFEDIQAMLATLFVSRGTPMLTAGDEFGRTQSGNNNAYAQDNRVSWLKWDEQPFTLASWVGRLVKFRRTHAQFFADRFLTGVPIEQDILPDVTWLSAEGNTLDAADWQSEKLSALGMLLHDSGSGQRLLLWFNRSYEDVQVTLPETVSRWETAVDFPVKTAVSGKTAIVAARSVAALMEKKARRQSRLLNDSSVDALAHEAGIQGEWWEVDGTHHLVSVESKRVLLSAMGVPLNSAGEARKAIVASRRNGSLPTFHVMQAGRCSRLPVFEEEARSGRVELVLTSETGQIWNLRKLTGSKHLDLPELAAGYYSLSVVGNSTHRCCVLVSPPACYLPHDISDGSFFFGLSSHLYALRHRSDTGIGDFATLALFAECVCRLGGVVAGINPLHHMFTGDRKRVSPYQPSDRRFIDPVYISLGLLPKSIVPPMSGKHEEKLANLRGLSHVDYAAVWELKHAVLWQAFEAFSLLARDESFEFFIMEGGEPLRQHAAFQSRGEAKLARYAMWLQWIADQQFAAAANRGRKAGLELGIYRDLALGCAYEGGEVQSMPDLFSTTVSLGAPPDPFSRDGQVWNLPPFNPIVLMRQGLMPFIEVLRANMRHAGVLRIDHILGYARQFWVPRGASGNEGAYVNMPTEAFIAATAIESHKATTMVIGEDLGTIPEGLRQKLASAAILSYRMLWFERDGQGFYPPASYPRLSAACLSSHDLKPFKGWQASASVAELDELETAIAKEGIDGPDLVTKAHAFVARTPSALMLVQADDLTGETESLNVPGTDQENPNWRRRLSVGIEDFADLPATESIISAVKEGRAFAKN